MSTRWLAVLFLMSCSETITAPPDDCGGEVCVEGQRCDLPTLRCVTNEAPRVVLTAPTTVVSDETFELTGTVTDDTEGTTLEWRDGVDEWQSVEVFDDGSFALTVKTRALDSEPMHLTVRADDGAKKSEKTIIVLVDRVGPKLELKSPTPGSTSGGSAVTITVVARDGSEGLQELRIGEQNVSAPRTGTELSAMVAIAPVDRRAQEVVVFAKDLNGNRTTQSFMVQVDGAGPVIRFLSPIAQTPTLNTPTFAVEVEATDLSAVERVRVAMDDGGFIDGSRQDGGVWSAEFQLPEAEQPVTFQVEATDGAGNTSLATSIEARLDRVAPTVALVWPLTGTVHSSTFGFVADTSGDAVSVTATFAGTTVALVGGPERWEAFMPLTVARDYSAEPLVVVARDAAGNQRTSAPLQLFIDSVAPILTFATPAANAKLNRSNFTGTDEVTIAWQVQDADPLAATVSVDGVPQVGNEVRLTTSPTDDGRVFTKTVVVADREGNSTTGSLTFSVDRVAPTVVSWLPAPNARNVDPRRTTVTFSERVSGPTTFTQALWLTPGVTDSGTWNTAHTSWTSDALGVYQVVTATLRDLTDDSGNPVVVTSRKFHTSAFTPASGLVLARDVSSFKVTSDSDGLATVAITTPMGSRVFQLSPLQGEVQPATLSDQNQGEFSLNSSLTVDPATLIATHRAGSARYGPIGGGPFPPVGLVRHVITNGVASPVGTTADAFGAVLSQGAFSGESDATPFAIIDGSTYVRGAASRTLPSTANMVVAQSTYTWAAFGTSPTALRWSRFLCIPNFVGSPTCTSFAFSAATSSPSEVRAAIAPNNKCLAATWKSGGQDFVVFQPLALCDEVRPMGTPPHPSCLTNQSLTATALRMRVAPFSGNGEATMLAAWESSGILVGKMNNPAGCTNAFTAVGSPMTEPATAYEPVQLGNKPALLYTDASRNLKLYVP